MKTLLILILLAGNAFATSFDQSGARKAACEVTNRMPGKIIIGSGTLVVNDLVLTAAHVFEPSGEASVWFGNQMYPARFLAADRKLDIAVLRVKPPRGVIPLQIATKTSQIGTKVEIWGFGPRVFRSFDATITHPIGQSAGMIGLSGEYGQATVHGDSGGAVVRDNVLVGVHWGYRTPDRQCIIHAVSCEAVRTWLQTLVLGGGGHNSPL